MVSPTLAPMTSTPASVAGWLDSSVTAVVPHSVAPGTVIDVAHGTAVSAHGTGLGALGWVQALGMTLNNGSHLNVYFGLVSCLLLALVAGLLLSLGQQLRTLKEDLKKAPLVGAELTQHLTSARQALVALQQAVKETSPTVDGLLTGVAKARQELTFLVNRAEGLAEKLAQVPSQPTTKAPTTAALAAYGAGREVAEKTKEKVAPPPVDLTVLPPSAPPAKAAKKDPLEDLISSIGAAPATPLNDPRSMTSAAQALEDKATSKISRRAATGAKGKVVAGEAAEAPAAKKRTPSQAELDLKARLGGKPGGGGRLSMVLLLLCGGLAAASSGYAAEGGDKKNEAGAAGAVTSTVPATPTIALPHNQQSFSPGEAEILQDLEKRRVALDRREQALELREKLADLLEQRLAARTSALEQLKTQLEGMMTGLSGKDDKQLQQLSQMYAAMKPDVAAGVMNKLDNAIVHDVLLKMPVKKSGKILEVMDPVKARVISEMMAQRSLLPKLEVSSTSTVSKTAAK